MKCPLPMVTGPCIGRQAIRAWWPDPSHKIRHVIYPHPIILNDVVWFARSKRAAKQFAKLTGGRA